MIASTIIATLVAGCVSFAPMSSPIAATQNAVPENASSSRLMLMDLFSSDDGNFSIQIPEGYSEPELQSSDVDSEIGDIKLHLYMSVNTEGVCLIGYSDINLEITDELKNDMLEGAKEGAITNMGATLQSEEDISIDGHPGRSIRFTTESEGIPMRGRIDYYMVKNRLYQVGFIETGNGSMDRVTVQNYFKSFKLAPAKKEGKAKSATKKR